MSETYFLDARGLFCPEPVMMLHKKFREMAVGDVLEVIATDPSTERDIPKFCAFLDHNLLDQSVKNDEFHYRICKAGDDAEH